MATNLVSGTKLVRNPGRAFLSPLFLLVCAGVLLSGSTVKADTIVPYNFTGTLATSGDKISGTFTLDLTNATIIGFAWTTPFVTFSGPNLLTPASLSQFTALNPAADFILLGFDSTPFPATDINLLFESSLQAFAAGGPLFTGIVQLSGGGTSQSNLVSEIPLADTFASGQATVVPEPSTLLMLGSGILGVMGAIRQRWHG